MVDVRAADLYLNIKPLYTRRSGYALRARYMI